MQKYFIAYQVNIDLHHVTFGNLELETEKKISNIKVLDEISRSIEKDNGLPENSITVINFQKFDE